MDLILLQPGNLDFFGNLDSLTYENSLNGNATWTVDNNNVVTRDGGTSGTSKFGNCIELVSLHQGMKQQLTADLSDMARTSGRPIITGFTSVKYVDETSVKLYEYCLSAQSIGTGRNCPSKIFIFRKTNETFKVLMTIQLRDAIISEIQLQSHPNDAPTEQFKLNFTEILWTYSVPSPDNGNSSHFTSGWSILRNQPIAQFTE
jgi:type VI secretion system secreted protein Hcp